MSASTISAEEAAPGTDAMRERVERTLAWTPWLVATNHGDVVGSAYASRHRAAE